MSQEMPGSGLNTASRPSRPGARRLRAFGACVLLFGWICVATGSSASAEDPLLPNGEPVVGVYYYPWFQGEPFEHVGLTPASPYNNIDDEGQILSGLQTIADYGINHVAFSYWDNEKSLEIFQRTLRQAEALREAGRDLFLSPYLEPPTIDKRFGNAEGIRNNLGFISTFLKAFGSSPCFARVGGQALTHIYVAAYDPSDDEAEFRAFLTAKFGDVSELSNRLGRTVRDWEDISLADTAPGTPGHVLLQSYREDKLWRGATALRKSVRSEAGVEPRCIGDCSSPLISPFQYMRSLGGLTWYNFAQAMTQPFSKPKIESELAKYAGASFFYTLSPSYIDTQQRWEGGRVEGEPFLYPSSWVHALCTLPEGIMILTHSEWYEGSVIDVSKEYGSARYEDTELYASVFKAAFASSQEAKRRPHEICVIFNEYGPYGLRESGQGNEDVLGWVDLLGSLSQQFDVLPESLLAEETLRSRKLVIVPSCRTGLSPEAQAILLSWVRKTPDVALLVTRSTSWADAAGLAMEGDLPGPSLLWRGRSLSLTSGGHLLSEPRHCEVLISESTGEPFLARRRFESGSSLLYINAALGEDLFAATYASAPSRSVPADLFELSEEIIQTALNGDYSRPSSSLRIKRGPCLTVPGGLVVPVVNVIPWGYLVEGRLVGWGAGRGHSARDTLPWVREWVSIEVPLPEGEKPTQATVIDSDSERLKPLAFETTDLGVRIQYPLFFHGLFHISTFPVRLEGDPLTIHPREQVRHTVRAKNTLDQDLLEVKVSLDPKPGLAMDAAIFSLNAGEEKEIELAFKAEKDFVPGNRSIRLNLKAGEASGFAWWSVLVLPEACLTTQTAVVGGIEGSEIATVVNLINIGQGPAQDIQAELAGKTLTAPGLDPGGEMDLPLSFNLDPLSSSEGASDAAPILSRTLPMTISSLSFGERVSVLRPVQVVTLNKGVATPPSGADPDAKPLLVVDPFMGPHPDLFPLRIGLGDPALAGLRARKIAAWDARGNRIPAAAMEAHVGLVAPLEKGMGLVYLGESDSPWVGPIRWEAIGREREALLAVDNGPFSLVWDARRGGNLVSLKLNETGQDLMAAPSGGAPFVHVDSSGVRRESFSASGSVTLDLDAPPLLRVATRSEDSHFRVIDEWEVWSGCPVLFLKRTVVPLVSAKMQEMVLLSVQSSKSIFERVMPNGVGFLDDQGQTRGWFETWAIPSGMLAHTGAWNATGVCLGLSCLERDGLDRVRYGFFNEACSLMCIGPRWVREGMEITHRFAISAGQGLHYKLPESLANLSERGLLVRRLDDLGTLGGAQVRGLDPASSDRMRVP